MRRGPESGSLGICLGPSLADLRRGPKEEVKKWRRGDEIAGKVMPDLAHPQDEVE